MCLNAPLTYLHVEHSSGKAALPPNTNQTCFESPFHTWLNYPPAIHQRCTHKVQDWNATAWQLINRTLKYKTFCKLAHGFCCSIIFCSQNLLLPKHKVFVQSSGILIATCVQYLTSLVVWNIVEKSARRKYWQFIFASKCCFSNFKSQGCKRFITQGYTFFNCLPWFHMKTAKFRNILSVSGWSSPLNASCPATASR